MESLSKLETRIDQLLNEVKELRQKTGDSAKKAEQDQEKIRILEKENQDLKSQLLQASRSGEEDRKKVDQAAQKVRELLGKLETF